MYSAEMIACYIIKRCHDIGRPISNLMLQKLLYFAQTEFLVVTGYPCFRENIRVMDFGPVVQVVYDKYKRYGSAAIPYSGRAKNICVSENDGQMINGIVDECAKYSASQLLEVIQNQDQWKDAYYWGKDIIEKEDLQKYFQE